MSIPSAPTARVPIPSRPPPPPVVAAAGNYWIDPVTGSPQAWNAPANWSSGDAFPNGVQAVAIINIAIAATQTIDLNQAITLGALNIGASGGAAAFNLAANGGTLTLDNSPGQAALLQLSTSKGDTISAPMSCNGSLSVSNAAANPFTLSGNISGAGGGVTVNGNVTMSGTNTYTGGTVLNGGTLVFSAGSAIPAAGTLALNNAAAVTVTPANSLPNVLVNGVNTITGNGNSGTGIASLNLAGALTLAVSGGSKVFDLTGTMTGSGTLLLGSAAMTLRFNGTAGDGGAIFNLGAANAVANVRSTVTTAIALGGLMGGPGTQLQGDNSSGGANMTYTVGAANSNTEFDGAIVNGAVGSVALAKAGAGALTLAGTNTYTAGTTVAAGTLVVNTPNASGAGTGAVAVGNGASPSPVPASSPARSPSMPAAPSRREP